MEDADQYLIRSLDVLVFLCSCDSEPLIRDVYGFPSWMVTSFLTAGIFFSNAKISTWKNFCRPRLRHLNLVEVPLLFCVDHLFKQAHWLVVRLTMTQHAMMIFWPGLPSIRSRGAVGVTASRGSTASQTLPLWISDGPSSAAERSSQMTNVFTPQRSSRSSKFRNQVLNHFEISTFTILNVFAKSFLTSCKFVVRPANFGSTNAFQKTKFLNERAFR